MSIEQAGTHARGLYDGCRLCKHYVGKIKCLGSSALMFFDPRPHEHQHFKLPELWACQFGANEGRALRAEFLDANGNDLWIATGGVVSMLLGSDHV
jgi:hypothetical protein